MMIKSWHEHEGLTTPETNVFCKGLSHLLLSRCTAGNTVVEQVRQLVDADDICGLVNFDLSGEKYSFLTVADAIHIRQVLALFQKRADVDIGVDKAMVALRKFEEAEAACKATNTLFRAHARGQIQLHPRVERVLHIATRKIANVLGEVPKLSDLRMRFGPGATTKVKKRNASARSKLGAGFQCSEDFLPLLQGVLEEVPWWSGLSFDGPDVVSAPVEIVDGKLSFVPKNAKTDRAVVVEPSLNVFLQLGIGDYIAERLLRVGVDLKDQTRNQSLARSGSIHGELATLDLSSASDTISQELVKHLLPVEWWSLLDRCRTGTITIGGSARKLHKFSSMGNGFTFPLESLIFWALARGAAEDSPSDLVSVYGDDIICPVQAVPLLREVLRVCGFTVNAEKSFWEGGFRESCGADYLNGIDIRPCYLKGNLSGPVAYVLHNFFVRHLDYEAATYVHSYIAPHVKLWGPDGYGDGCLLLHPGDSLESVQPHRRSWGYGGYTFDVFTQKGRKCFRPTPGDYVYPAYSCYLRERMQDPLSIEREELPETPSDDRIMGTILKHGTFRATYLYGTEVVESFLARLKKLSDEETPFKRQGDDRPFGVTLPGSKGYKRISIYTLTPAI